MYGVRSSLKGPNCSLLNCRTPSISSISIGCTGRYDLQNSAAVIDRGAEGATTKDSLPPRKSHNITKSASDPGTRPVLFMSLDVPLAVQIIRGPSDYGMR